MGKSALILEGGAFRGVFTSGVLDHFMENNIEFDYVVGVSAGAGNGLGFLSHQIGRTNKVIHPPKDVRYYGTSQFFKHGKFLNLDKMFYEYPFKQFPFDFETFNNSKMEFEIVVANCEKGVAEYYGDRSDMQKLLSYSKASCSVPILCKPVEIGDYHYLDGSICDSIPIKRALEKGCDKLVVVMTKSIKELPTNYGGAMKGLMKTHYGKKYPNFYKALLNRTKMYARQLELLGRLEKEGVAIVLRPSVECIKKFEQDDAKVDAFYENGKDVAGKRLEEIKLFLSDAGPDLNVEPIRSKMRSSAEGSQI